MKNWCLRLIILFSFFGCEEKWDDPIPEGAVLGTPFLISSIMEDGNVMLTWNISRLTTWFHPTTVEGSSYEVFAKFPGSTDFTRIASLNADHMTYLVGNSEYGQPHEFYVTAHRAGQTTRSNRIMTVPHPIPEYKTLMELESWDPLYHPKINLQGTKLAFITNYRWTEAGQDFMTLSLFLLDIVSGQTDLVKLDSYHPQWSADGRKVIFATTEGLSQTAQGYTPSHLLTFDVETKVIDPVIEDRHQQMFPSFGKEENSVLFLSDSLERGKMGLWKSDNEGITHLLWPSFQLPEHGAGLPLTTGMDASNLKDIVALDHLSTVENRSVYNIYTVEFGDQVQKHEFVGSPWNDMSPVFSPANENILAFVSDRSGTRQVWTFNSSSGKLNQVSFFQDIDRIGSDTSLSWTDQGRSLALPVYDLDGNHKMVKIPINP
ncbi:TolB-like translocation protein [Cyclobacterium plantarum]|uniref:Uncharacterized protein n=1 Tax=Cyclobacterium plantarum TaxID=2716263 RepID=A0ABX0HBG4_9BACT|nr:hypothetical protein [Cyclobacterium plantarum]NHE58705.1 hypothetical protein [Cyclobacterium plantarum]